MILRDHKSLCLTPYQLALLSGLSGADKNGFVDYTKFASNIVGWITEMFSIDAIRRKAQLIQLGHFKVAQVNMPKYNDNALFAIFRTMDIDHNGFLEWNEYQSCLERIVELGLTKEECLTLNLLADVDGDGKIDY